MDYTILKISAFLWAFSLLLVTEIGYSSLGDMNESGVKAKLINAHFSSAQ